MARFKVTRGGDIVNVEISDMALVLTILGVVGGALATVWLVTRDPRTLRSLGEIAEKASARLVHRGRPLLRA